MSIMLAASRVCILKKEAKQRLTRALTGGSKQL
jgi:hypothetical protein